MLWLHLGGSLTSSLQFFAENKHILSNTFWLLWPPGLKFLTPYRCCQERQLCKTKPYAMERRNLPRETSALHNMTWEQRAVLDVSEAQGRKCGLFALLISKNVPLWLLLCWVFCRTADMWQPTGCRWASGVKVLDMSFIKSTAKEVWQPFCHVSMCDNCYINGQLFLSINWYVYF